MVHECTLLTYDHNRLGRKTQTTLDVARGQLLFPALAGMTTKMASGKPGQSTY